MKCHFHEEFASCIIGFGYRVPIYHHTPVQSMVGGGDGARAGPQKKQSSHLLSTFYVQSDKVVIHIFLQSEYYLPIFVDYKTKAQGVLIQPVS